MKVEIVARLELDYVKQWYLKIMIIDPRLLKHGSC